MVFNTTFNNISVISCQSVLLVEETGVPQENHWPAASHWQTLSHNLVSSTPRHERGWNSLLLVVIDTDCTGSCKSNYHTITTMIAPLSLERLRSSQYMFHCVWRLGHYPCASLYYHIMFYLGHHGMDMTIIC